MSINEETKDAMREMGLNAYEIDTYLALLEGGQMTAMEISRTAQVPYSKIYEVLNTLKEKGWIKNTESRPFKYYPVPPLEATRSTKLRLEDKILSWENTVAETLQPLYEKRELVERPDMLILRGQQAVVSKLEEVLKKSTMEIMIAAPEFAKAVVALAEPLIGSGLKKTVKVKLMAAGKKEDWLFIFAGDRFFIIQRSPWGNFVSNTSQALPISLIIFCMILRSNVSINRVLVWNFDVTI